MVPLFLLPFSVFPVLCSNRSSNLTHFHPSGIPNGFSSSVMGASVFERALFVRLRSLSIFSSKNSREFSGVLGALPLGEGVAENCVAGWSEGETSPFVHFKRSFFLTNQNSFYKKLDKQNKKCKF